MKGKQGMEPLCTTGWEGETERRPEVKGRFEVFTERLDTEEKEKGANSLLGRDAV